MNATETTVEIRLPEETTATGAKCWAKRVTSISARAKTGHDWQGDWAQIGRLIDANHGDVFVVGGSHGSRKNQSKCATLWIVDVHDVDGDGSHLFKVERDITDEWAINLRSSGIDLLSEFDPDLRVIRALDIRAKLASEYAMEAEEKAEKDRASRLEYSEKWAVNAATDLLNLAASDPESSAIPAFSETAVRYGKDFADAYAALPDMSKRDAWVSLAMRLDAESHRRKNLFNANLNKATDPERLTAIETIYGLMKKFGITLDELKKSE